jgi:hypothetical protein
VDIEVTENGIIIAEPDKEPVALEFDQLKSRECFNCAAMPLCNNSTDTGEAHALLIRWREELNTMQEKYGTNKGLQELLDSRLDFPLKMSQVISDFYIAEAYRGANIPKREEQSRMNEVVWQEMMTDVANVMDKYVFIAAVGESRHTWAISPNLGASEGAECDDYEECDETGYYGCPDDCEHFTSEEEHPERLDQTYEIRDMLNGLGINHFVRDNLTREMCAYIVLEQNRTLLGKGSKYLGVLADSFEWLLGRGGGFGGTAWERIASAGYKHITGTAPFTRDEQGTQLYLDHIFSLEHNNGCFFDKNFDILLPKDTRAVLNAQHLGDMEILAKFASKEMRPMARALHRHGQMESDRKAG